MLYISIHAYSSIDGYLDGFQVLIIVNNATVTCYFLKLP